MPIATPIQLLIIGVNERRGCSTRLPQVLGSRIASLLG